jgi:hypothetical protein
MRPAPIAILFLATILASPLAHGQTAGGQDKKEHQAESEDKKGSSEAGTETESGSPLKILVVISEFADSKKISSLPYTLYTVSAGPAKPHSGPRSSMRYGVKVPLKTASNSFTYQNIGTDIDYGAYERTGGSYQLVFTIDRSWVGTPSNGNDGEFKQNVDLPGAPVLPTFRDSFTVVLRDGQTVEGAAAVDPITGHVLKVDVTLTVLK